MNAGGFARFSRKPPPKASNDSKALTDGADVSQGGLTEPASGVGFEPSWDEPSAGFGFDGVAGGDWFGGDEDEDGGFGATAESNDHGTLAQESGKLFPGASLFHCKAATSAPSVALGLTRAPVVDTPGAPVPATHTTANTLSIEADFTPTIPTATSKNFTNTAKRPAEMNAGAAYDKSFNYGNSPVFAPPFKTPTPALRKLANNTIYSSNNNSSTSNNSVPPSRNSAINGGESYSENKTSTFTRPFMTPAPSFPAANNFTTNNMMEMTATAAAEYLPTQVTPATMNWATHTTNIHPTNRTSFQGTLSQFDASLVSPEGKDGDIAASTKRHRKSFNGMEASLGEAESGLHECKGHFDEIFQSVMNKQLQFDDGISAYSDTVLDLSTALCFEHANMLTFEASTLNQMDEFDELLESIEEELLLL